MKKEMIMTTLIILALTACGEPASTTEATEKSAAAMPAETKAEAKAEPVSLALDGAITKEFMTGKWADVKDGDCALAQDFKADGTVDGFFESWKLEGDNLVVTIMDETKSIPVKMIDANQVDVDRDGKIFRLVRC